MPRPETINDIFDLGVVIMYGFMPILLGIAGLFFVFNVIKYIITNNEKERKDAVNYITYSVFSFFVIVALWGIVGLLINTFNLPDPYSLDFKIIDIEI